ncbi:hypothetical protein C0993_002184 [Termitomyces sp. T159_Od127]|nr:hypothetical protein C0993_002184 [Termitomyces sp. T159_Od127]
MSETFTFDVSYATTFEDLEKLREKMLVFVKTERRDYQPSFDVVVKDFPDQEKLTLSADIKYKTSRRNKWICALKTTLVELKIYGPAGNPDVQPPPMRYTKVPYEEIKAKESQATEEASKFPLTPHPEWQLADKDAVIGKSYLLSLSRMKTSPSPVDQSRNVFGEADEVCVRVPDTK